MDILQTAAINKNGQITKNLFEMFKNNIPGFVEPIQKDKYRKMYGTLKKLVPQTIQLDDDTLIHNCIEMYGKFIIGYERYSGIYKEHPFNNMRFGLLHKAIEHFVEKKNIASLKRIQKL
eukprot:UN03467